MQEMFQKKGEAEMICVNRKGGDKEMFEKGSNLELKKRIIGTAR